MVRSPPPNPKPPVATGTTHANRAIARVIKCQNCGHSWETLQRRPSTVTCRRCGRVFATEQQSPTASASGSSVDSPSISQAAFNSKKVAAGVCGILFGGFGVHKFIIGLPIPGAIMLTVSILSCGAGVCCLFPFLGSTFVAVVGLAEGIIYLAKTEDAFYRDYAIEKRWFF